MSTSITRVVEMPMFNRLLSNVDAIESYETDTTGTDAMILPPSNDQDAPGNTECQIVSRIDQAVYHISPSLYC